MVPGQRKTLILFTWLNLIKLCLFLRKNNEKDELVKLVGYDVYLEELRREEEKYKESKTSTNPYKTAKTPNENKNPNKNKLINKRETYLEELRREEEKYKKGETGKNLNNGKHKNTVTESSGNMHPELSKSTPTDDCGDLIEENVNIKYHNLQFQAGIRDPKACAAFCKSKAGDSSGYRRCKYWTWRGLPYPVCFLKTSSEGKFYQKPEKVAYGMKIMFSGPRPC